jgi:hypothetical protein
VRIDDKDLRQAVAQLEGGDWRAAHEIVQKDEVSPLACWAHGIVHLMEGDVPNARYWYRQAGETFPEPVFLNSEISRLKSAVGKATDKP